MRAKYGIEAVETKEYAPGFLIKRLQHYMIRWESEDESTESVAVEQGFSHLLYEDNQRRYILEGKIDHIAYRQGLGLIVEDHKTQSRAGERYELNHQVFNYYNFVKPEYFVYNYIGLQEKPNDKTFVRQIYKPHPGMIEQWKAEVMRTFDAMYSIVTANAGYLPMIEPVTELYYPRRRSSCDGKYGLCQFHNICAVPDDSKFKPAIIGSFKEKDLAWRAWT